MVADTAKAPAAEPPFRTIIDEALLATVVFNADGVIQYANAAFAADFGQEPAALRGQSLDRFFPSKTWETVMEWVRHAEGAPPPSPVSVAFQLEARRGEAEAFPAQIGLSAHCGPGGRTFVMTVEDVSEPVRLGASLRGAQEDFKRFLERLPEAVAVSRDGFVLYANPLMEALLKVQRGGVVGRAVESLSVPEERADFRKDLATIADGGTVSPALAHWLASDGNVVTVTRSLSRMDFPGGPALVLVARDERVARALAQRTEQLERIAAISTLASGVGHEINNPMSYVISNLVQLEGELKAARALADRLPSDSPKDELLKLFDGMDEMLRDARDGTDRVRSIVQGLRMFAVVTEAQREPVDIRQALETALGLSWDQLRSNVVIVRDYHEVPPVSVDPERLTQVLRCLITNAAQALAESTRSARELRLSVTAESGTVNVEVKDTGPGMTPQVLQQAFDPFFTTRPVGQGTGLGLFIVQSAVEGWGGKVVLTSVVGEGTSVRVSLPALAAVSMTPIPGRPPPQRRSVLIVDDEPCVARALRRTLVQHHQVTEATSARKALELLAAGQRFDAILCDVMMPDLSGVDFVRQLESIAPGLMGRVVLMTGGLAATPLGGAVRALGVPVLEKPFETSHLLAALDKCFAGAARS
jgi:PAS domain S-box-containing protein